MGAELEKIGKKRGGKERPGFVELKIEIPMDRLELVSSTVLLNLDTTPPDRVIVNLGQGVDIVKPGETSSVVLTEKVYRIRKPSRRLVSLPAKGE